MIPFHSQHAATNVVGVFYKSNLLLAHQNKGTHSGAFYFCQQVLEKRPVKKQSLLQHNRLFADLLVSVLCCDLVVG